MGGACWAKQSIFKCFGSKVLVLCGLVHRANVHACRYDIWRSDGVQAFSKNVRQLTGHATRTVGSECLVVKYYLKYTLHDTSFWSM